MDFYRDKNDDVDTWGYNSGSQGVDTDRYYDSNRYGNNPTSGYANDQADRYSGNQSSGYGNYQSDRYESSQVNNYSNYQSEGYGSNQANSYSGNNYNNYNESNDRRYDYRDNSGYNNQQYNHYDNHQTDSYNGCASNQYGNPAEANYAGFGSSQADSYNGCASNQYGNPAEANYAGFGGPSKTDQYYENLKRNEARNACRHTPSSSVSAYEREIEDLSESSEYRKAKKILFKANNGSAGQLLSPILILAISILAFVLGQGDNWLYGFVMSAFSIVAGAKCSNKSGLSKFLSIVAVLIGLYGFYTFFPIKIHFG